MGICVEVCLSYDAWFVISIRVAVRQFEGASDGSGVCEGVA